MTRIAIICHFLIQSLNLDLSKFKAHEFPSSPNYLLIIHNSYSGCYEARLRFLLRDRSTHSPRGGECWWLTALAAPLSGTCPQLKRAALPKRIPASQGQSTFSEWCLLRLLWIASELQRSGQDWLNLKVHYSSTFPFSQSCFLHYATPYV